MPKTVVSQVKKVGNKIHVSALVINSDMFKHASELISLVLILWSLILVQDIGKSNNHNYFYGYVQIT